MSERDREKSEVKSKKHNCHLHRQHDCEIRKHKEIYKPQELVSEFSKFTEYTINCIFIIQTTG